LHSIYRKPENALALRRKFSLDDLLRVARVDPRFGSPFENDWIDGGPAVLNWNMARWLLPAINGNGAILWYES
jgi:hypothetical protein